MGREENLLGVPSLLSGIVDSLSKLQTFALVRSPSWRTRAVLQHGGSILGCVILDGTFQRISQLWDNAHILNLENCLLYLSSIISQFLDFIH